MPPSTASEAEATTTTTDTRLRTQAFAFYTEDETHVAGRDQESLLPANANDSAGQGPAKKLPLSAPWPALDPSRRVHAAIPIGIALLAVALGLAHLFMWANFMDTDKKSDANHRITVFYALHVALVVTVLVMRHRGDLTCNCRGERPGIGNTLCLVFGLVGVVLAIVGMPLYSMIVRGWKSNKEWDNGTGTALGGTALALRILDYFKGVMFFAFALTHSICLAVDLNMMGIWNGSGALAGSSKGTLLKVLCVVAFTLNLVTLGFGKSCPPAKFEALFHSPPGPYPWQLLVAVSAERVYWLVPAVLTGMQLK